MFGRDKAIDPLAEAAKALAASKGRRSEGSTEFAREMLDKAAPPHAPKPAAVAPPRAADAPAAVADPRIERYKRALAKQGKTLTPEQLAALEKMGEAQKAVLQKVGKGVAWIPRIIITLVVLFILRDMIPDIVSMVKSLVAAVAP